ncbi:hypothetical protein AB6A40_008116 [Gnathostoma spinigerum]|uniref:Uncharacterized protein n=1 Tax=Gnathostoma spinigerum TaxID=75299 RepID=A0ABD6EXJ3_9BILA
MSLISFLSFLFISHYSMAHHCLVMKHGYGLISEACPRMAVACRIRIENNMIVWYEASGKYDRDQLACVFRYEYDDKDGSGCTRKASGVVRCWCYGQDNCNDPWSSRLMYDAYLSGNPDKLSEAIARIENTKPRKANVSYPLSEIAEIIQLNSPPMQIQSSPDPLESSFTSRTTHGSGRKLTMPPNFPKNKKLSPPGDNVRTGQVLGSIPQLDSRRSDTKVIRSNAKTVSEDNSETIRKMKVSEGNRADIKENGTEPRAEKNEVNIAYYFAHSALRLVLLQLFVALSFCSF